jgi:ParB-like nuclease domain
MRSRQARPHADTQQVTADFEDRLPSPIDALTLTQGKPTPGSTIQSIALDHLCLPTGSRRKISPKTIQALSTRIHATGQLQSLMVVPNEEAQYYVVAGERRFAALQLLVEKGLISRSFPVPCRVIEANPTLDVSAVAAPRAQPNERRRRFLDLRERCPGLVTGSELAARQSYA